MEPLRHAQRVIASDRHERVEPEAADALEHGPAGRLVLARIRA